MIYVKLILWSTLAFPLVLNFACGNKIDPRFLPGIRFQDETTESPELIYTQFILDDFGRADETPLSNPPWSPVSANVGDGVNLSTFAAIPVSTGVSPPTVFYTTLTTNADVRISVVAKITGANYSTGPPAGELLIYGRSTSTSDINNTYFCGINPNTMQITIGKSVLGVQSPLVVSTGTASYDNGDIYKLTFTIYGTTLTCSLVATTGSDNVSASVTDNDLTAAGYTGFAGGKNGVNELTIDDFLVELITTS